MTQNTDKKSFIVRYETREIIRELSDTEAGQLFKAMFDYEIDGTEPDFNGLLKMAWIPIRQTLTRDGSRYMQIIEKRREAGRLGGLAKAEAERKRAKDSKVSKTVENTEESWQNVANLPIRERERERERERDSVCVCDSERDSVPESGEDSHTHTESYSFHGIRKNVKLTGAEYDELKERYNDLGKLLDKVSCWLANAEHDVPDHVALVHKFALNDNWPKKRKKEKPPDIVPVVDAVPMPEETRQKLKQWKL